MCIEEKLNQFQKEIVYEFKDKALLCLALTHPSFHESQASAPTNQRLEFLGDSVLSFILTDELYHRFPYSDEGHLTQQRASLIRGKTLSALAQQINIHDYILLSQSERKINGHLRESTLEDAMEALIGAIYLDGGIDSARNLIIEWITRLKGEIEENIPNHNPKGELQEWVQENMPNSKIRYRIINENGPAHNKHFDAEILIDGSSYGVGSGKSKKAAESHAAFIALDALPGSSNERKKEKS